MLNEFLIFWEILLYSGTLNRFKSLVNIIKMFKYGTELIYDTNKGHKNDKMLYYRKNGEKT